MTTTKHMLDDWRGCYKRGWGKELVPAAFAHPAKVSFSLAERIYQHCADEKWLAEGDTVLDPFGGIGGFAYHALGRGLHFVGVELEPRFVALGNENIALWNKRYAGRFAKWGTARIVEGDSRRMLEVVGRAAAACVSSPPFGESIASDTRVGKAAEYTGHKAVEYAPTDGNLGNLPATEPGLDAAISSPPYAQSDQDYKGGWARFHAGHDPLHANDIQREAHYGQTVGQLGAMPAGSFDASIASPPFIQTAGGTNVTSATGPLSDPALIARHAAGNAAAEAYGESVANLGNMAAGDYTAAVSSPPYEHRSYEGMSKSFAEWREMQGRDNSKPGAQGVVQGYGSADGQLAGADNFWTAARAIVDQTYAALRPGGHAVWVVKSYVRGGQLVDFPGQWRQLCEAAGFVTLHEHRAWVVENRGTQLAHDGNHKAHITERKSFFRRLAEKKGSPRIDFETGYCMVKSA